MKRFLLAACLICSISLPAHAALQQIRVMAVGIDRSSVAAQTMAVNYAKQRAVYLAARKLQVENATDKVAAFTPQQWHEIVRGAEIRQLRREGERTYADVIVTIVDTPLRRALKLPEGEIRDFTEAALPMRGVLVMPVFVKGDRPYLWEKENELREPLRAEVLSQAHGAVLVPAGDLEDLRLVDYQNALSVTSDELKPMFERYGAQEIVVAVFTLAPPPKPVDTNILLRRLEPTRARNEIITFDLEGRQPTNEVQLQTAAAAIATAVTEIAASTAGDEQERLVKATKIPVEFVYANPRELASLQETLRSQKQVLLVAMPSISLGEITGIAYIEGDPQKLREKLRKSGMIVRQSGNSWKLSLR